MATDPEIAHHTNGPRKGTTDAKVTTAPRVDAWRRVVRTCALPASAWRPRPSQDSYSMYPAHCDSISGTQPGPFGYVFLSVDAKDDIEQAKMGKESGIGLLVCTLWVNDMRG